MTNGGILKVGDNKYDVTIQNHVRTMPTPIRDFNGNIYPGVGRILEFIELMVFDRVPLILYEPVKYLLFYRGYIIEGWLIEGSDDTERTYLKIQVLNKTALFDETIKEIKT